MALLKTLAGTCLIGVLDPHEVVNRNEGTGQGFILKDHEV